MIVIESNRLESSFTDTKSFREVLKSFECKLSNIEIDNDELSDIELMNISNEFDTIVELFGFPRSVKNLNKDVGTIYYEECIYDGFDMLKTIQIFRGKFDIVINNDYDIPTKYYIESVTYNTYGYGENKLVTNKLSDLDKFIDKSILRIKFNDQSVKPNFDDVYCNLINLLNIGSIDNNKYVFINKSNRILYDIFYLALNDLSDVFCIINLFGEPHIDISLFEHKYSVFYVNPGSGVTDIHISKGYIDIDIHKKSNKRMNHYYVDSIIINNVQYPDINLITDSVELFESKLNIINQSLDRYKNKVL